MADTAYRQEYPRPQFRRNTWINLNGEWDFTIDQALTGEERGFQNAKQFDRKIQVPFCPESRLSGIAHTDFMRGVWYTRTFTLPAEWQQAGRRSFVHIGACDYRTKVFINGQPVGQHTGGYSSFCFEITHALTDGENRITVFAEDDTRSGAIPSGKQSPEYYSYGCFYTRTTGIWQTVWLERVPENYIDTLTVTPDYDARTVTVKVHASKPGGAANLWAVVRAGGVTIAEDWGSDEADRDGEVTLNIAEEHFFPWSPDSPFLYDLTVGTTQGEEEGFDTVHSYFALRKWECKEDAKGIRRFFLNDRPILLNGLLDQGYWPDGLYTPPSDAAVEHELHTVRELGFNLLRKHAKIEPERWYYHCDKLGIIVWQDMVNGGGAYPMWYVTYLTNALQPLMRRAPDGKLLWGFLGRGSAHSREEYARELADTVAALGQHPCIGCWVPFNEGWGQFDARKATETLRALDPSRPVDEASGWFDRGGGDVHSIHNYFYPLRIRPNVRTVALSEYGGIAWPMPGHEPPRKTYGYGTARSRAELTDVEDEVNGLFTYDRTAIKPDAAAVRAVNEALEVEFEKAVKE